MKSSLLIATVLVVLAAAARAQYLDPVKHGRQLVGRFCSQCHAVARFGRGRNKNAPPFRTLGRTIDLDQFDIVLARGLPSTHPDMPNFKFSIEDARDVRDYLRSIQR